MLIMYRICYICILEFALFFNKINTMKNILFFVFIFSTLFIFSQSNEKFDKKLLVKFSKAEIIDLKNNQTEKFLFYEYCIDNASYLVDMPKGKDIKNRLSVEVEINDINNYIFYSLDITPLANDYLYFTVKDKDLLFVVKSSFHIKEQMKSKKDF